LSGKGQGDALSRWRSWLANGPAGLRRMFRSTSFRLLMLFALFFTSASLLVISYLGWSSSRLLEDRLRETIIIETRGLAEQYRSGGVTRLARTINSRIRNPGNSIYLVTDGEGGWIAGNVRKLARSLWNREGKVEFAYERAGPDGRRELRHAVARIYRLARGYRLMVGRDIEDQRRYAGHVRNAILSGLLFMLAAGLGAAWLLGKYLLSRIDMISRTSRMIMDGDLSRRVPVVGAGDELDRLASDFNAMLERIEQLMNAMREVSGNIAHDLKTPLSRMRSRLEAGLRGKDEKACREVLEKTIEESDELIKMFNALLSIARLEAGGGKARFANIDPRSVVEDVVELYEPLAEESNMRLVMKIEGEFRINGDRQLLGQALANLIDNAIKYGGGSAPEGSEDPEGDDEAGGGKAKNERRGVIAISLSPWRNGAGGDGENGGKDKADMVSIAVCDRGEGIASHEHEKALRRFGRLEQSRSRPGTGLGLSLVTAIAGMHGGQLLLEDNEPGLCGRLILPVGESDGGERRK
jgi:signal transduction histidine kinase